MPDSPAPPAVRESEMTLPGEGRPVRVERFDPPGEPLGSPRPPGVVLHGADGLSRRGPTFRATARQLAAAGYRVLLPHYFDRTGSSHALGAGPPDFSAWAGVVSDAVSEAGPGPVGVFGFS